MGGGASKPTETKTELGMLKGRCGVVRQKYVQSSQQARKAVVELLQGGAEGGAHAQLLKEAQLR